MRYRIFVGHVVSHTLFAPKKRPVEAKKLETFEKEGAIFFDHAPCGYHAVDGDGTIVSINGTLLQWLGYEKHELVGKIKFTDLIEGHGDATQEKINRLVQTEGMTDLMLIRKNGSTFPVTLSMVKDSGPGGDPSRRLFSTLDNTRCHEALERIKTLDQELEAFSYSISHDLRAPLRSIDGYSRILQEDYARQLDDEGRRVLNVVMNNARRMGTLIDDLLEFGRLGRMSMQRANVNMTSLVRAIVDDLQRKESGRTVKVNVETLHDAFADADMMRLVWSNLLENAFKYTGKKDVAEIRIRSYRLGDDEVCYEISDNGVGFDMQYAPKLFGVFQRLHRMQDFSGTGVGLAIVKRIISRHGGRVWAQAAVNEGATFYFTLPLTYEDR